MKTTSVACRDASNNVKVTMTINNVDNKSDSIKMRNAKYIKDKNIVVFNIYNGGCYLKDGDNTVVFKAVLKDISNDLKEFEDVFWWNDDKDYNKKGMTPEPRQEGGHGGVVTIDACKK